MIGTKVKVYFNLHKKLFSVQDFKTRKVIAHVATCQLVNVQFKVSESGRQRVLNERRKNVHAFVIGEFVQVQPEDIERRKVIYNPYLYNSFVDSETKQPVHSASSVILKEKAVYATI